MTFGAPIEALAKQQLPSDGGGDKDPFSFLDPELREAAHKIQSIGPQGGFDAKTLAYARAHAPPLLESLLPQVPVAHRRIPGRGGMPDVTVHIINSDPNSPRPGILHTHGGGFILGSAEFEVPYLQRLAQELDCIVVTVEYRLAPETTYQGSIEDNYTALSWAHANAREIGLDRARIALLGESAGGGHAALLAQAARDRGEVPLVMQALIYPMLDDRTGTTHNMPAPIGSIGWNAAANRFGWQAFLGHRPGGPTAPKGAVPARVENLKGLAPAFIGVGAIDLFVSEDIEYARRLIEATVPTELFVIPGAFHGFDRVAPEATVSKLFTTAKLNALRRAFGQPVKT
jgi:acetyl esterase/lipase